ncbi:hypothetical protein Ahy_A07g035876 isoform I [Arachis hypogaea]|uniref:Uncharacterized protein n=1 Tax=Arachis hypogaea TaxID=3818 RepID=A0A445CEL8_ARAHY|nr:hypothetical protein Ahy_A07g035876 isoform I [Arachis hypogaea]
MPTRTLLMCLRVGLRNYLELSERVLTVSGVEKIFDIIGFVYQYLKLLHQIPPQEWIFRELQSIGKMDFRFAEEQRQDDYAAELSENLLFYPPEHVMYGDYVYQTWDEQLIKQLLGFFIPENMRVEGGYANAQSCVLFELFILLLKDELNESYIWTSYNMCLSVQASIAMLETSVSYVGDKLELKVYGFNEKLPVLLSKVLSVARSFIPAGNRFEVHHIFPFISYQNVYVILFARFHSYKRRHEENFEEYQHEAFKSFVIFEIASFVPSFYDIEEKLHHLNDLFLDDLIAFIPELRSKLYIEGLCHGNISEEVIDISNIFKTNFIVNPLPVELRHAEHVICLSSSANLVRDVCVKNKSEKNSVVELYFQIEQDLGLGSIKLKALIDLFEEVVDEPLFNQLRTKEQLGYVVECSLRLTYSVFGFCFCVQSSEYDPIYVQDRIDNFIDGVEEMLVSIPDSFYLIVLRLMMGLMMIPLRITKVGYWQNCSRKIIRLTTRAIDCGVRLLILDKRYIFDISKKEAEELKNIISKQDVVEGYRTYFRQSSPKCQRLLTRLWGCNTKFEDDVALPETVQAIKYPASFKMSSEFYQKSLLKPEDMHF